MDVEAQATSDHMRGENEFESSPWKFVGCQAGSIHADLEKRIGVLLLLQAG